MNAIEILKETWQEYIARRKLERTPIVEISWSEELRTHVVRFGEAPRGKVVSFLAAKALDDQEAEGGYDS